MPPQSLHGRLRHAIGTLRGAEALATREELHEVARSLAEVSAVVRRLVDELAELDRRRASA